LKWLLAGMVDATAIDSTVLERLICERAELFTQICVIQSIAPSRFLRGLSLQKYEPKSEHG
jgi:hypothetical protein